MIFLRRLLDRQKEFVKKHKLLAPAYPLVSAIDTFLFEPAINTVKRPHIRDAVDLKRWMILVVIAMIPAIFMAIWNTGVQEFVYASGSWPLMEEYLSSSSTFEAYINFVLKDSRYLSILQLGLIAFLPVVITSYTVGGMVEGFFAYIRKHEIAEGFLVTGMLFPLVLPPSIPLWMVALGVAVGIIVGKELFGGTGMNILNPALTCRAFLFFGFPNRMSGDVWVGTHITKVAESLKKINNDAQLSDLDGLSQSTPLSFLNITESIKTVQVDAIASNTIGSKVATFDVIMQQFSRWQSALGQSLEWTHLSASQLKAFVTSPIMQGGLGLAPENYKAAYDFASLKYGLGHFNDATLFFGNHMGSMGETSTLACLLGAVFLILTRIASWRSMAGVLIGIFATASLFNLFAQFNPDQGAWASAKFTLPAYKHLLMGGVAFGLVFMATDPVSSPGHRWGRWIYGFLIGFLTVVIRLINPAYPEGIMLSILFANVFAPLIDHYVLTFYRRRRSHAS